MCKTELSNFINLKNSFVSKQEKLYGYFGPVKKEEEFVEAILDEFEPMVEVKTESFEHVFEDEHKLEDDRLHSSYDMKTIISGYMNEEIFDITEKIDEQTIDNTDNLLGRRTDSCPNCLKSFFLESPKNQIVKYKYSIKIRLIR